MQRSYIFKTPQFRENCLIETNNEESIQMFDLAGTSPEGNVLQNLQGIWFVFGGGG